MPSPGIMPGKSVHAGVPSMEETMRLGTRRRSFLQCVCVGVLLLEFVQNFLELLGEISSLISDNGSSLGRRCAPLLA